MLLRLVFATKGAVRSVPTVAVMIAALGIIGVAVGAVALLTTFAGLDPSERSSAAVMLGVLGVLSLVMAIAGGLVARSGASMAKRDGPTVRWRRGSERGSLLAEHVELSLRPRGLGRYRSVRIVLVDRRRGDVLELGGSVFEAVARWQRRRFAARLGV